MVLQSRQDKDTYHFSPRELSGSDIDPPPVIIRQSTRMVDIWFAKCEASSGSREHHSDIRSSVSISGQEGKAKRPHIDVGIWQPEIMPGTRDYQRELKRSKPPQNLSTRVESGNTNSRNSKSTSTARYEDAMKPNDQAPEQRFIRLPLKSTFLRIMGKMDSDKQGKGSLISKLQNFLRRKKVEEFHTPRRTGVRKTTKTVSAPQLIFAKIIN